MGNIRTNSLRVGLISGLLAGVALGIWLAAKVAKKIVFTTGEMTDPGTLNCLTCDTQLHFTVPGKIPPCGNCHGTEFWKSTYPALTGGAG